MKHRRQVLALLSIGVFAIGGSLSGDASAKRLGAGKTSGMMRSDSIVKRDVTPPKAVTPAPASAATPTPQAPAPAPSRSGMWGMLGGLALGVGLGALMSHFGMGAEFGGLLMVMMLALGAFFLFKMFFRRPQPAPINYAGTGSGNVITLQPIHDVGSNGPAALAGPTIPADFDSEGFLRQAKVNFGRLQAANDVGNLDDIRQFTTPEMFGEIQLEYQERGRTAQRTDVVQLDAKLLDLTEESNRQIASVRFQGLVREAEDASPESIDEVWHLIRPRDGSGGWILAGIQQSS